MQHTLFGTLPDTPLADEQEQVPAGPKSRTARKDPSQRSEPKQTLFGIVETKAQARKRAQEIVRLLGAVEDAPEAIACRRAHIETTDYFIDRSNGIALDPNDRDGLLRCVGDLEELLEEEDCQAMRDNGAIWRPYPCCWLGKRPGEVYAAALHPKEIAYLREVQAEMREEIEAITEGAKQCQSELEQLRTLGPLREDIAQRYGLTTSGERNPHNKVSLKSLSEGSGLPQS